MSVGPFDEVVGALPAFGLAVLETLPLHRRFDRKHLVRLRDLPEFVDGLGPGSSVLEVSGDRFVAYSSVYFDTPDLATYHHHRQGRRRRFKVRTRHYGDPLATMLEVKAKGVRGRTVKHRTPHPGPSPHTLDDDSRRFVADTLEALYGMAVPEGLVPVLETRFLRSTVLAPDGDRVTVDRDLHVVAGDRVVWFDRAWAVVESKSDVRHPAAEVALRRIGARTERISKYCLGVAALNPGLPSNRWRRAQRVIAA